MKKSFKKIICTIICSISILLIFTCSFLYIYSLHNHINNTFFSILELSNGAFILISVIVAFAYIKISIDQWFPDNDDDMMSIKDRIILIISIITAVICGGLFIITIIYNNLTAQITSKIDNMRLTMLLLTMFNTFVAYAYYQYYQVLKFNNK